jgi:hypothetical protein
MTSLAERIEIGEQWEVGQMDPEIAAAMGSRVSTVRKWWRHRLKEKAHHLAVLAGDGPWA